MKRYQAIILGGGISGVVFGRLLQLSGCDDFIILEAQSQPGGLCRTQKINNHWLDTGGGHFLCTKYPQVYDFVFAHLPKTEFNFFQRVSKLKIEDYEIDYPIESNLWQLPIDLQTEFLISVLQNGEAQGLPAPQNFEAWVRWKLGDRIAESYMLPYNQKIWGVAPHDLDVDWLHKIPKLDLKEMVGACLRRASPQGKMPSHEGFYYPKQGGFQTLFDAIVRPVEDHIHLDMPADLVESRNGITQINNTYEAPLIINTIPWSKLNYCPDLPTQIAEAVDHLKHNSIVVSLHEQPRHPSAHWVYEPDLYLPHHRSFFIHNFAPHSQENGVYYETNSKRWDSDADALFFNHNEYAYPIPTVGRAGAIDRILTYMASHNIIGLGRWGQWQYFNSDVCIWEAMKLFKSLFNRLPDFPH